MATTLKVANNCAAHTGIMQISEQVFDEPLAWRRSRLCTFSEMDVDLGNTLQDVQRFIVHLGELLYSGRTDQLSLRKKLAKGTIKPFLYNRVRMG